mgnify:CR=1 FL=1
MLAGAVGTVRLLLRAPLGSGRGRVVLPQTRCGPPSPRPGLLLCLSAARTMSHLQAPPQPLIRQVTGRPTPTIHPSIRLHILQDILQDFDLQEHFGIRPFSICDRSRDSSQGADNFELGGAAAELTFKPPVQFKLYNVAKHSKFHFCKSVHKYTGCFFHWYPPEKFQVQNS